MIVVADTSPLNYLVRLGHAHILHHLYGRVLVPRAVVLELQHSEAPPDVLDWISSPPEWLEVVAVRTASSGLAPQLGAGESEAIHLAMESGADLLLMDDRSGREQAEARHLRVSGTLAVLLEASLAGHLQFAVALENLRRFGFRFSEELQQLMLERYERVLSAKAASTRPRTSLR